jgi:NDP-sugar pyrophosphorylase family protein
MNIVIPMAGKSSSFSNEGIETPKPFIDIKGKTMVQRAYESLNLDHVANNVYFIALEEHKDEYDVDNVIKSFCEKAKVVYLPKVTSGPAETLYQLKGIIPDDEPMLQTNVDQILDWDSNRFVEFVKNDEYDAVLVTINVVDPHYSYARYNHKREAIDVMEKTIISNEGLIGTHYWKKASDYFRSFEKAKEQGLTYNDEIYVSLTFNPLIEEGKILKDFKLKQSEKQNVVGDVPSLSLYEDRL